MLTATLNRQADKVTSSSQWLEVFDKQGTVTADQLERFRALSSHPEYVETVLRLARKDKLRPKVLADAAYMSWLKSENPKKIMSASSWTELFRLSYRPDHVLFEVQD